MKRGVYNQQKLEEALQNQGLMSRFFLKRVGDKIDDDLPIPHHSGYVAAPADGDPLFDHQKITG